MLRRGIGMLCFDEKEQENMPNWEKDMLELNYFNKISPPSLQALCYFIASQGYSGEQEE
jgi:hypothetical protein